MRRSGTILMIVLLASIPVKAVPPGHSPFSHGSVPKAFPVRECRCIEHTESPDETTLVFTSDTRPALRVQVTSLRARDWDLSVKTVDAVGAVVLGPNDVEGTLIGGPTVYCAQLNEDKRPDFIVEAWTGGCGLGGEIVCVSILLSHGDRFSVVPVTTFDASSTDFVDLNRDGRPEFVHAAFIFGEAGADGKAHNYWVYNLLHFKGTQVLSANGLDRRFPCWIWYTDKPNHKNTRQLTSQQKRRLWEEQAKDLFPNSAGLAAEQAK
jgi:hypothetical protein